MSFNYSALSNRTLPSMSQHSFQHATSLGSGQWQSLPQQFQQPQQYRQPQQYQQQPQYQQYQQPQYQQPQPQYQQSQPQQYQQSQPQYRQQPQYQQGPPPQVQQSGSWAQPQQQPQQQSQQQVQAPVARQDIDAFMEGSKNPADQEAKRASLGLTAPPLASFLANAEFISIGNFCAVANALEALGLRKQAYPFDWVRSPAKGIIHLFNNKFSDFFQYGATQLTGDHGVAYTNTAWGGSFWHHDIQDPKVKASFQRRIDRILGKGDVPDTVPRVFVRTLNSSDEIGLCLDLHKALQKAFKKTTVYLLLLLDMQDQTGPLRLAGSAGDNILFYRIPLSAAMTADINVRAQGYWPALAFAVRYWACRQDAVSELPSLQQLKDCVDGFDGGDPAVQLYAPRRLPTTPPTPMPPPVLPRQAANAGQAQVPPLPPPAMPPAPVPQDTPDKGGYFMDVNGFLRRKGEGTWMGFKEGMSSLKDSFVNLKKRFQSAAAA
eukprot:CAMPEP_0178405632 /NCGR_PEP_ID=MMETSP0689_2-20121128/18500_1 /TAXON_ID=160604 /ORGANISM="Amphidinium massartii, Strain CS-259" /LENGTH=489 /DNA_ID=CAMNT_0020026655 /DNA_START=79 /DNA_END=1548 /DNA_ORIENTATION=+